MNHVRPIGTIAKGFIVKNKYCADCKLQCVGPAEDPLALAEGCFNATVFSCALYAIVAIIFYLVFH